MSTNESPPETTPTPTPTHCQEVAAQFRAAFAEIIKIMPQLEGATTQTATFVRTHQNIPRRFMETVVDAVDNNEQLKGLGKLDVPAARDALQFIEAFRPVCNVVADFLKDLRNEIDARQAVTAVDCLQVYGVTKHLARDADSSDMQHIAEAMKHELGRKGRGKKKRDDVPPIAAKGGAMSASLS